MECFPWSPEKPLACCVAVVNMWLLHKLPRIPLQLLQEENLCSPSTVLSELHIFIIRCFCHHSKAISLGTAVIFPSSRRHHHFIQHRKIKIFTSSLPQKQTLCADAGAGPGCQCHAPRYHSNAKPGCPCTDSCPLLPK